MGRGAVPVFACPVCLRSFVPVPGKRGVRKQKTCLRDTCVSMLRKLGGQRLPAEAQEASRARRVLRLMDGLRREFGALSDRELLLVRRVYVLGHKVGYHRGFHARRKAAQTAQEAA